MSDQKMRLAIIAGASYALKYREEHPRSTDREALKHVTENSEEILKGIEEGD
jgi:hypothetical protein